MPRLKEAVIKEVTPILPPGSKPKHGCFWGTILNSPYIFLVPLSWQGRDSAMRKVGEEDPQYREAKAIYDGGFKALMLYGWLRLTIATAASIITQNPVAVVAAALCIADMALLTKQKAAWGRTHGILPPKNS